MTHLRGGSSEWLSQASVALPCVCSTPQQSAAGTPCSWLLPKLKWLPFHWSHTWAADHRSPPVVLQSLASCGGAGVCAVIGFGAPVRHGSDAVTSPDRLGRSHCCWLPVAGGLKAALHLSFVPDLGKCPARPSGNAPYPAAACCCWPQWTAGVVASERQSYYCLCSQSLLAQSSRCCCPLYFSP